MLRRLEKRILVPLPDDSSRAKMFKTHLEGLCVPEVSWADLAASTEGYSGRRIVGGCGRQTCMRDAFILTHSMHITDSLPRFRHSFGSQGGGHAATAKADG